MNGALSIHQINFFKKNHNKETKRKGKKKPCVQKIKTMCGLVALNFELT
jgi:hypothetical protein